MKKPIVYENAIERLFSEKAFKQINRYPNNPFWILVTKEGHRNIFLPKLELLNLVDPTPTLTMEKLIGKDKNEEV